MSWGSAVPHLEWDRNIHLYPEEVKSYLSKIQRQKIPIPSSSEPELLPFVAQIYEDFNRKSSLHHILNPDMRVAPFRTERLLEATESLNKALFDTSRIFLPSCIWGMLSRFLSSLVNGETFPETTHIPYCNDEKIFCSYRPHSWTLMDFAHAYVLIKICSIFVLSHGMV